MAKRPDLKRCAYCDASIDGEHEFDAVLHDPWCPHGKALSKLDAAEKERDRAVAKAARLAELDPDGEQADDDMQEALREIEDLTVGNVNHENTIATLQSRLDQCSKLADQWAALTPEDCSFQGEDGRADCASMRSAGRQLSQILSGAATVVESFRGCAGGSAAECAGESSGPHAPEASDASASHSSSFVVERRSAECGAVMAVVAGEELRCSKDAGHDGDHCHVAPTMELPIERRVQICDECERPVDSEPHLQHCPEAIRG